MIPVEIAEIFSRRITSRMFVRLILFFSVIACLVTACAPYDAAIKTPHAKNQTSAAYDDYWMGRSDPKEWIANFDQATVDKIKIRVNDTLFPVRQERADFFKAIAGVRPVSVTNWDNFGAKQGEPFGGGIEDYWLNERSVLRLVTIYRGDDGGFFNSIESAELITPEKAHKKSASLHEFMKAYFSNR